MSTEKARTMSTEERVVQMRSSLSNHTPTDDGLKRIRKIRSSAKLLGEVVLENTEVGRDQSLAMTALEDVVMRAVRAVALEGPETDAP